MFTQMQKIIRSIDAVQRHFRLPGFVVAVIKKYSDDEAGHRAALLTYYAFLSLFPLLLVLTTLTEFMTSEHARLQDDIINGTTNYFPVLGVQLSEHVHTLQKSGLALFIGIIFTLYGARGVADAFRHSVRHIWGIPKQDRDNFPKSMLKSLIIILVAGVGFVVASLSIGLAASAGHGFTLQLLTIIINLVIWSGLFVLLLNISLPRHIPLKETRAAALTAAIGLVILQTIGGYIIRRELRHLDALYSYFALALGLLFWIYLQVQVLFYSLEIASVRSARLWPRSLTGTPTKADLLMRDRQAATE